MSVCARQSMYRHDALCIGDLARERNEPRNLQAQETTLHVAQFLSQKAMQTQLTSREITPDFRPCSIGHPRCWRLQVLVSANKVSLYVTRIDDQPFTRLRT